MHNSLAVLVERLEKAFGANLVSVILYGSAASGDYNSDFSDVNVLCVLDKLTPEDLYQVESIFKWWRKLDNPAPLLMKLAELGPSTDCFPIEFTDMKENRKVLSGRDVVADLVIDRRHWRSQLEYELRSKLMRLRQHAAATWTDRDGLMRLCVDSVSTFCVLGRHALGLAGGGFPQRRREVVAQLAPLVGDDLAAFTTLLDIRERKVAPLETEPTALLGKYLTSIDAIIRYVDGLSA